GRRGGATAAAMVRRLADVNLHFLAGVVPVAEPVPRRAVGLRAAGEVRRARAQADRARLLDAREQLPPLPAVPLPLAHETGPLPGTAADTHLDARDRGFTGPGHPSNRDVAVVDLRTGARLP